MKKPSSRRYRSEVQREKDKIFCYNLWLRGYEYRKISQELQDEYDRQGITEFKAPNYKNIHIDIRNMVEEYRAVMKNREIETIDELNNKLWFLYNEALTQHRVTPNPGYVSNAHKILETLGKLKGVFVDKKQVEITGTMKISEKDIDEQISKLKKVVEDEENRNEK